MYHMFKTNSLGGVFCSVGGKGGAADLQQTVHLSVESHIKSCGMDELVSYRKET